LDVPKAFLETEVAAAKAQGTPLFADFMASKEPYASLFRDYPWLRPPKLNEPLPRGGDHYWKPRRQRIIPIGRGLTCPSQQKTFSSSDTTLDDGVTA